MGLLETILIIVIIIVLIVVIYNVFFKKNTMLMNGIHPASPGVVIHNKNMPEMTSSNYSFALWFFVEDWNTNFGQVKSVLVFNKGKTNIQLMGSAPDGDTTSAAGKMYNNPSSGKPNTAALAPNNTFAVALDAYENNMLVGLQTFAQTTDAQSSAPAPMLRSSEYFEQSVFAGAGGPSATTRYETFRVTNINIQKWVCLICVVCGRALDIYLHGKLVRSFILPGVAMPPGQDNAYIGGQSGTTFHGHVARFQLFDHCLSPQDAYNIYREGLGSNMFGDFFNKYRMKIQFYEYNHAIGKPIVI
jgi:hypothetical protein